MFTGLVEYKAEVAEVQPAPPGMRLTIVAAQIAAESRLGDSIAVNGCCLTVVGIDGDRMSFEAGPETLKRTTLGRLQTGSHVNIERSLRVGDRMGGHFVTGHVDGLGRVAQRVDDEEWSTFWFEAPAQLTRQMASKGSITVEGVSLTLVEVEDARFSVALIPHSLAVTTLGDLAVGDEVNLETDLIAKYLEQQYRRESA